MKKIVSWELQQKDLSSGYEGVCDLVLVRGKQNQDQKREKKDNTIRAATIKCGNLIPVDATRGSSR